MNLGIRLHHWMVEYQTILNDSLKKRPRIRLTMVTPQTSRFKHLKDDDDDDHGGPNQKKHKSKSGKSTSGPSDAYDASRQTITSGSKKREHAVIVITIIR